MSSFNEESLYSPIAVERAEAFFGKFEQAQKQLEALRLASEPGGPTNKAIARKMKVAPSMVDKHLQRARAKLGGMSREQAIAQFLVADHVLNWGVSDSGHLPLTSSQAEKMLREQPNAETIRLLEDPVLQQFLLDSRSSLPKRLDARVGRWWRLPAIVLAAIVSLAAAWALFQLPLAMATALDSFFAS